MENKLQQQRTRIDWIDFAKGIGIILVVIGHCLRDDMGQSSLVCFYAKKAIYSFHMPLFFAISGAVFACFESSYIQKGVGDFLRKKANSLLKPFIVYSLIIYAIFWSAFRMPGIGSLLQNSSYEMYGIGKYLYLTLVENNPYAYHLWYIWAMFIVSAIIFLLDYCMRNYKHRYLIILLISAVVRAVYLNIIFPEAVKAVMSHMIYFAFGLFAYKATFDWGGRWKKISTVWFVLSVIYIGLHTYFDANNDVWSVNHVVKWILVIANFGIIVEVIQLSKLIKKNRLINYLGRNSFVIYLFHQPFFCAFLGLVLYSKLNAPIIVTVVICFAASFVFPLAFDYLCKKNRITRKIENMLFHV